MKPIIITIKDNNVVMSIEEFKKHINDAYHQGYQDGSLTLSNANDNHWWKYLTCNDTLTTASTTTVPTATLTNK